MDGIPENAGNNVLCLIERAGTGMANGLRITQNSGLGLWICVITHRMTAAADEKTGKGIANLCLIFDPGYLAGDLLRIPEKSFVDYSRVPAVVKHIFRIPGAANLHGAVTDRTNLTSSHPENLTGIDRISKDSLHGIASPGIYHTRMKPLCIETLGNQRGAEIFISPHLKDLTHCRSFRFVDGKGTVLLLALENNGLIITVRSDGADIVALLNGQETSTVHDALLIFQVFVSALQFALKDIPVILIGEVISLLRRNHVGTGIPKNLDKAPGIFQIATGQTLHLHTENGLDGRRFYATQHGKKFRPIIDGLSGDNFSIGICFGYAVVMERSPLRQDTFVLAKHIFNR